jgi:hypothetical protein
MQGFAPQGQPVPGSEVGGVEGADGAKGAGGCGAPGAGGAEEAGAAQGASGPQGAGEAQNLLTSADRNKDGKIDINELKDFLRQAGVPEEQVDQLAQKLMAEGGPEGLTPQNLTRRSRRRAATSPPRRGSRRRSTPSRRAGGRAGRFGPGAAARRRRLGQPVPGAQRRWLDSLLGGGGV